MISVERSTAASPAALWAVMSDLDRWGERLPTVDAVRALDAGKPAGIDARYEVRQPGFPKAIYTITDWRPDSGFTWVATGPGMRATATHEIIAAQGATTLKLGVAWSGPVGRLVRARFTKKGQPMVEREADTMVRLAEAG